MNHSHNESKVKQARKKSIEINRAARYDKIEKEPQDPKVIERWFRNHTGRLEKNSIIDIWRKEK